MRRIAHDDTGAPPSPTIDQLVSERVKILADYQDAAYADRYRHLVERVRVAEASLGSTVLTEAVARHYFKLLAIKDEYEVARLHAAPAFMQRLRDTFEGDFRISFHLAPPLLAKIDPNTGHPLKRAYGPWMLRAFGVLAKLRFLRGTVFDVFGNTDERRAERQAVADYEADVALIIERLTNASLADALALAQLPEQLRGFGHVRAANATRLAPQRQRLRAVLACPPSADAVAAA